MSAERLSVEGDVTRASTLPSDVYTSEAWYQRQLERVFARSWHLLLESGAAASPGDLVPLTFLPGSLDEPLLLARDRNGVERLMSNVCTHRGNLLCTTGTNSELLRCNYHGRCFALDGRFLQAPGFEGADGFPDPSEHLPKLAVERWGPFAFTSLDPSHTIRELLGPIERRLAVLPFDELQLDATTSREHMIDAHWALVVENYLEGLHIPLVHPELADHLDEESYRVETLPWGVLQVGLAMGSGPTFDIPEGHHDLGQRVAAYFLWLYPGTMLSFFPWGVSVNMVQPVGPKRTRLRVLDYVADVGLRIGAGANLEDVEDQDVAIVTRVQRGVSSRLYDRGRYSPLHEAGVHHFHRLLARDLNG